MTEHLGAEARERTDSRRGYRNGSYERKLTTRVGTLELEVPRDREGTFDTALFQRYQRSEKALVKTLMQYGPPRSKHSPSEKDHHRALRERVFALDRIAAYRGPRRASSGLGRAPPGSGLSLSGAWVPLHLEVRRQGAVRSTAVLLAVGIGEDGQREILGLSGGPQRDRAGLGAAHRPAQRARTLRRRGGHQQCTRRAQAGVAGGVSGPNLAAVRHTSSAT